MPDCEPKPPSGYVLRFREIDSVPSEKATFSTEQESAQSSQGRLVHRRGQHGRRRAHRAQVGAGAGGADARAPPQRDRGGVQRALAGVRWHAERGVAGVAALHRRRGRRPQVPFQAGQLFHGTAVHEASVQRAGSLKRDRCGRRVRGRRRCRASSQDRRPAGDERVQRRRRVARPRRRRRGLVRRAQQRTVGRRGRGREMRP